MILYFLMIKDVFFLKKINLPTTDENNNKVEMEHCMGAPEVITLGI